MPVMLAVTPLRSGPVTVTRTRSVRVVGDMAFCGRDCSRTRQGRVIVSGVIRLSRLARLAMMQLLTWSLIWTVGAAGGCSRGKPVGRAAEGPAAASEGGNGNPTLDASGCPNGG